MTFAEALASAEAQYQQQRAACVAALPPEQVVAIQRNAAKVAASKTYQVSVGGRLEVLEDMGNGRLEVVAIKYGYDNWVNA